jgi:hypothetical protein
MKESPTAHIQQIMTHLIPTRSLTQTLCLLITVGCSSRIDVAKGSAGGNTGLGGSTSVAGGDTGIGGAGGTSGNTGIVGTGVTGGAGPGCTATPTCPSGFVQVDPSACGNCYYINYFPVDSCDAPTYCQKPDAGPLACGSMSTCPAGYTAVFSCDSNTGNCEWHMILGCSDGHFCSNAGGGGTGGSWSTGGGANTGGGGANTGGGGANTGGKSATGGWLGVDGGAPPAGGMAATGGFNTDVGGQGGTTGTGGKSATGGKSSTSPPVCTPGQDQTCNDDLTVSMLWGHCDDPHRCSCNSGYVVNTNTGKCNTPPGVACYSPKQNIDKAYVDRAFGCACNNSKDTPFCGIDSSGLVIYLSCEATGAWQSGSTSSCTTQPSPYCYSPSQNVDVAYDAGAVGCVCNSAPSQCVTDSTGRKVGLVCTNNAWQAVNDGPCAISPADASI